MTAIIGKTLGYITMPTSLLLWLFNIEIFQNLYWVHICINIVINILLLLWIGSLVDRKNEKYE
ncbi:MAG: hypothetical protein ACTSXL_04445 [Alphaproteobacteria bacterium]